MPMGKKVLFRDWKARLESIIREELGSEVPFDEELAADFWRNGYGPKEFFRDHVNSEAESDGFDPRFEM